MTHQGLENRREHDGGQAEGGHGQTGGKSPARRHPFLDAAYARGIGKAAAESAEPGVGEIDQPGAAAADQSRQADAGGKQAYAEDAGRPGALAVVQNAAEQAAENEGHQHIRRDHRRRARAHAEPFGDGALQDTPEIDDADAHLHEQAAAHGYDGPAAAAFLVHIKLLLACGLSNNKAAFCQRRLIVCLNFSLGRKIIPCGTVGCNIERSAQKLRR